MTRDDMAIRDIPAHCACRWAYFTCPARWIRFRLTPGCSWHRSAP
jgi:hypothetical protein